MYAKQFPYAFEAIILNLIMYPHSLMHKIHTFDTFQERAQHTHSMYRLHAIITVLNVLLFLLRQSETVCFRTK